MSKAEFDPLLRNQALNGPPVIGMSEALLTCLSTPWVNGTYPTWTRRMKVRCGFSSNFILHPALPSIIFIDVFSINLVVLTLFRSIILFCGTDNISWIFSTFILNMRDIPRIMLVPQNTVVNMNNVMLIGVPLTILSSVQILPFLTPTSNEHFMISRRVVWFVIYMCVKSYLLEGYYILRDLYLHNQILFQKMNFWVNFIHMEWTFYWKPKWCAWVTIKWIPYVREVCREEQMYTY